MNRETIIKEVEAASTNKRLSCPDALKLAEKINCSPKEIGDVANELDIKIVNCSLGCF